MSNGNEQAIRRPELGEQFTNFNQPCVHQANGIHPNNIQSGIQAGIHQNGGLKPVGQLHHHPFPDYCLNKSNLSEEEQLLSPNGEPDFNSLQRAGQQAAYTLGQQQFTKYIANLNPLNGIAGQFHPSQPQAAECRPFLHNHPLYAAQQPAHVRAGQLNQLPSLICAPAEQQAPTTILKQTQPLQLLIDDQSDLNTTDINMDSSPCSESASDLNRQFSARPHKDGEFRWLRQDACWSNLEC